MVFKIISIIVILNLFLLNNIYLDQRKIHYITNRLLQNYSAKIGKKVIATNSHLDYQSILVHARLPLKKFIVNLFYFYFLF